MPPLIIDPTAPGCATDEGVMKATALKILKRALALILMALVLLLAWRAYDALRAPELERWHTFVPTEAKAAQIAQLDWAGYLELEKKLFEQVRTEVTDKLPEEARVDSNRYFGGSPIYPGRFAQDWNRSYVLAPTGAPVGAVVLLHGLTDSPYSLRHVARRYVQAGYVAVAIRLPGHGTVPAGLAKVEWEQWMAATHLAVREARRLSPAPAPLHVIGFSNGGALAMKYALDALDDKHAGAARPHRAVRADDRHHQHGAICRRVRLAGADPGLRQGGMAGHRARVQPLQVQQLPGQRRAPVLAGGTAVAGADRPACARRQPEGPGAGADLPVGGGLHRQHTCHRNALYAKLPANGSELVLFDLNRHAKFGPLLRRSTDTVLERLLPDVPRNFRTTVVTNTDRSTDRVVARTIAAGSTTEQTRELGMSYRAACSRCRTWRCPSR